MYTGPAIVASNSSTPRDRDSSTPRDREMLPFGMQVWLVRWLTMSHCFGPVWNRPPPKSTPVSELQNVKARCSSANGNKLGGTDQSSAAGCADDCGGTKGCKYFSFAAGCGSCWKFAECNKQVILFCPVIHFCPIDLTVVLWLCRVEKTLAGLCLHAWWIGYSLARV